MVRPPDRSEWQETRTIAKAKETSPSVWLAAGGHRARAASIARSPISSDSSSTTANTAVGSRLPAGACWPIRSGVSRPTVREALIALRGRRADCGIRVGSGIYCAPAASVERGAPPRCRIEGPLELLRARAFVESAVAEEAAAQGPIRGHRAARCNPGSRSVGPAAPRRRDWIALGPALPPRAIAATARQRRCCCASSGSCSTCASIPISSSSRDTSRTRPPGSAAHLEHIVPFAMPSQRIVDPVAEHAMHEHLQQAHRPLLARFRRAAV